jgi:peptide/nickel transport system substrate-binding protein
MKFFSRTALPRRAGAVALFTALALGAMPAASQVRAAGGQTAANTLTIGWNVETKTLDPGGPAQNPDIWVMVNIYDQLLRVGPDGKTLTPDLATSWSINKAGTAYTFHLRSNVVFQDGTKLTAADVAYDLNRARQPAQYWGWTLTAVKNVTAPDPSTVVITLTHPWAPLLSDVSLFDTGIYPEAYFKKVGASHMAAHPIGTGPYAFVNWVKGQYILLKKNPNYWAAANYPMQYVEYDLIPNDNTRLLKTEAGELDVDNILPYNQIAEAQANSAVQVQINPSTETNYFLFNTTVKPFGDVNVRQAINHAINRAAIVKAILVGHGTPANSFMPAGAIDYDPNLPVPAYDPTLAKQYLSKSSVPNGFSMTIQAPSGDSVSNDIAQIMQSELAVIGIKVTIQPVDPTTLFNNQQVGKYISAVGNIWTNDIPDPDELVSFAVDYTAGSKAFETWYDNPALIALSHNAEQTNDAASRQKDYYKIQQIMAQDVPILPLFYTPFVNAVTSKVHGFSENPLGYFNLAGVTKSS